MEQTEAFKNAEIIIQSLEKKLALCSNINGICDQSAGEAEREIEEHFAKCFNALAARKDALLREVKQKIDNHKKNVEDAREILEAAISACKKTRETALTMYRVSSSVAEAICNELKNVTVPEVFSASVLPELSSSLIETIQSHGKVNSFNSNTYAIAESVTTFPNGSVSFASPITVYLNPRDSCFYVCENSKNSIKKLTIQGEVSTFVAENNEFLKGLSDIVVNINENIFYVTNYSSHTICKISASGAVSVFAGSGQPGQADGVGPNASFKNPRGIAIDQKTGNLFVCDQGSGLIRMITPQGKVSTLAGFGDAKLNAPWKLYYDEPSQSLLVCEYSGSKLRQVTLTGKVSTLCTVPSPLAIVKTVSGSIIVSSHLQRIYKIVQNGQQYEAVVLAGKEGGGRADGRPEESSFNAPFGLAIHEQSHSCFVADYGNNAIRKISFVNPAK